MRKGKHIFRFIAGVLIAMLIISMAFAKGQTKPELDPNEWTESSQPGQTEEVPAGTQDSAEGGQPETQDPIASEPQGAPDTTQQGEQNAEQQAPDAEPDTAQQGEQNAEQQAPDGTQVGTSGPKDEPVDVVAPPVEIPTIGEGEVEDGDMVITITSASNGTVDLNGSEAQSKSSLKTVLLIAGAVVVAAGVVFVFAKKGKGKA